MQKPTDTVLAHHGFVHIITVGHLKPRGNKAVFGIHLVPNYVAEIEIQGIHLVSKYSTLHRAL